MDNCFSRENPKPFISLTSSPSIPKIPKAAITAQSPAEKHYPELALFKHHIEQKGGGQARLYTRRKTQVLVYKSIFFGFAALFALLGLFAGIPSTLGFGWIGSSFILKSILMAFCFPLSAVAFSIGYKLRTEKEAIMHQVNKSLAYAAKIYAHKRARIGVQRFFFFLGADQRQVLALKQMYQEVCEKIYERKDETMHLICRISGSPIDANKQEHLYNQAIEELRDRLNQLNHAFRNAAPPHYT